MSNPIKKMKTDVGPVATMDGDDRDKLKRKVVKKPAMELLDLSVDALFSIFEQLDVMDLLNVAQACDYLKPIAFNVFKRKHKILKLDFSDTIGKNLDASTAAPARQRAIRLLATFGSLIIELEINFREYEAYKDPNETIIIDSVLQHCTSLKAFKLCSYEIPDHKLFFDRLKRFFTKLQTLHLKFVFVEDYWDVYDVVATENGNFINFFDGCASLVELKLCETDLYEPIFRNYFPKLEHLVVEEPDGCRTRSMDAFITRHPNLKTYSVNCEGGHVSVAAANLPNIEKFGFQFDRFWNQNPSPTAVESLTKFKHLKELSCFIMNHEDEFEMSRLLKVLPKLAKLEVLDLRYGRGNREFVQIVNSLKTLKVIRLEDIAINGISNEDLKGLLRVKTVIIE